jgi:hypothetical protein
MESPTVDAQLQSTDPTDRARRVGELIDEHQAAIADLSQLRREALSELVSLGHTQTQIAELLGMTRSRIGQLLSSGPRPERGLLGSGRLMVALGGKLEAGKEQPGPVVSEGTLAAYEALARLARTLGLEADYEIIPPPGMVHLNRTNLVVICGPRLSPLVAQVLESDSNLGFDRDDEGWFIIDKTTDAVFRSPGKSDATEDYAYIGRLPRPDRKGTFLYLAGIHAIGTLGAVHYIENHLPDLYREVKTRGFSLAIRATYDESRTPTATELVTPIYRHEGI